MGNENIFKNHFHEYNSIQQGCWQLFSRGMQYFPDINNPNSTQKTITSNALIGDSEKLST